MCSNVWPEITTSALFDRTGMLYGLDHDDVDVRTIEHVDADVLVIVEIEELSMRPILVRRDARAEIHDPQPTTAGRYSSTQNAMCLKADQCTRLPSAPAVSVDRNRCGCGAVPRSCRITVTGQYPCHASENAEGSDRLALHSSVGAEHMVGPGEQTGPGCGHTHPRLCRATSIGMSTSMGGPFRGQRAGSDPRRSVAEPGPAGHRTHLVVRRERLRESEPVR